ncbi:hypothetical protein [Bradyrhizobium sp. BRP56]|uniref:hypothetical protein n=1 Tax=Bradyrhizobium sp. BRP56 TaxID=2793819 RepID=UPI001CD5189D|nr:hypothetical protein [Bradyrhizobium sp. BRP56]MCA1397454.1 hypothetical protein [Bradyrhizobium sp. BRP56]
MRIKTLLPTALALLASSSAFGFELVDIERASGSPPVIRAFDGPRDVFEYDLKVRNLCDNAQSLNNVASGWVGAKRTGNIFQDGFNIHDRSVALAAVVTFPNAKSDQIKQVKVPIIAKANFGDVQIQNCEGTIITDVPANAKVRLHFEYKQSDTIRFNDPTKFVSGIATVGTSAVALGSLATGTGIGSAIVPVVSYLEKNSNAITTLNNGVNSIMASFAETRSPDPRQYEIRSTASNISYRSGRKTVISIDKIVRDTGPDLDGGNGWLGVDRAFSDRYGELQSQFNNAQNAVDSPWSANLPKFCAKLRSYVDGATRGDRFASALGIGFHAFYNSTEYGGKTCLNSWEIAALKAHHFAPPFPGAWPTNATTSEPVVAARSSPKPSGKSARMANALASR